MSIFPGRSECYFEGWVLGVARFWDGDDAAGSLGMVANVPISIPMVLEIARFAADGNCN
jgi:hypothetical protein